MRLSHYARILAVTGNLGLLTSLLAWHLWLVPASYVWPVLLLCLPLLLALPGLLRGKAYTYGWCSLLVMLYLAYLLTEFLATSARPAVAPALFAAGLMFAGCSVYGRLLSRETGITTEAGEGEEMVNHKEHEEHEEHEEHKG